MGAVNVFSHNVVWLCAINTNISSSFDNYFVNYNLFFNISLSLNIIHVLVQITCISKSSFLRLSFIVYKIICTSFLPNLQLMICIINAKIVSHKELELECCQC